MSGCHGGGLTHSLSQVPEMSGVEGTIPKPRKLQFHSLLKQVDTTQFWAYSGSLTAPPCTEGVQWIVMQTPVAMPPGLLKEITAKTGFTSRYTQPLNGRYPMLCASKVHSDGQPDAAARGSQKGCVILPTQSAMTSAQPLES